MMQLTSPSVPSPAALAREQPRQRQAERGERAGVQEVAAGQAVAERRGAVGIEADHGAEPPDRSAESASRATGCTC